MNESEFWGIIDTVHQRSKGDMDKKCSLILKEISALSKDNAIEFMHFFDSMMDKAYSWELWGAAYVLNGGCGDDTFSDFRASLISRGEETFKKTITNPDSLADEEFNEGLWFYEGYQYAVSDGVEAVVGKVPNRSKPSPEDPSGTEWDEENEEELQRLYPKLWMAAEANYS